jgi:hypothetical protein
LIVGQATVEVGPNAAGFGPKTQAAILKALAGVTAKIELTIEETGLRTKLASAVRAASTGLEAQIGTNLDASPIKGRVRKAVQDAVAEATPDAKTQLDLFDIDPAALAAQVVAAKELARAALAAGNQLELELDFDTPAMATKLAGEVTAAVRGAAAAAQAAAGDLELDIEVNEAALAAEMAAASAAAQAALAEFEAKVNVDALEVIAQVEAAMAAANAAGNGIEIEFELEGESEAAAKASAFVSELAASLPGLDVEIDLDDDGLRGDVSRAVAAAEAGQRIEVPISAGGGGGGGDGDRVGAAAGGIFGRAVLRSAGRVLAAGGLAQLFTSAVSGAVALAGGLTSATGAAGSLVATVASLPGLLSAAAQAAASIGFALGGVGGALKAYTTAQNAIGKAAAGGGGGGDGGASARAAERAIRNATRGIEDAYRSAAEAVEAATERIEDAGRSLIRAQRDQQEAQEDLTRARVEAREEADELRRSVERLSLTESEARRRLAEARIKTALQEQRAQQDLTGASEDTIRALERQAAIEDRATFDPRQKAANDLRDAELDLEEATAKRVETEAKLIQFERTGVEGTERVIEARERLAEADDRLESEERDLLKANRDLVRAQEDGARRIEEAQERLADAIESAAAGAAGAVGGAAGAIDAYEAALARLSPAARRFVEFLVGLEPILRRVQATAAAGLFPGLETAITTLLPVVDDLEPILGATAKAIADLAIEGANLVASPAFRGDLVLQGQRNIEIIRTLGGAGLLLINTLRNTTIAAGPLTQHLADVALRLSGVVDQAVALGRQNGTLEAFFGRVGSRLDKLLVTIAFLGTGLFRVFRDATPAGDAYLDTLTRLSARFDILTDRASRSGALRDFFDSARPPLEAVARLLSDLTVGLVRIGTANFGAFTAFIDQLRNELLPVLLEVLGNIDTNFLNALVSLTTGFSNLFGSLLAGNPTLTLFVNVLAEMADGISTLLTDIPVLSPILQGLVTAFGALAVIGAVTALKQFASSIFGVEKALMTMTGATDAAAFSATRTGRAFETAGALMGKAFLIAGIIFAVKSALDAMAPSVDKVVAAVMRSEDPLRTFEQGLQRLNNPGIFDKLVASARNALSIEGILRSLRENFSLSGAKGVEFGATTEEAFRKLAAASPAHAQTVIDGMRAAGRSTADYEKVLGEVITQKAKHGIAEDDVRKKVDAATRSLQGNNAMLQEHTDKMRAATSQALSLSGAEIATEEAVDRLSEAVTQNGATFDTNTAKGRENKRALDDLVGSIQREIQELGKATAAGEADNGRKAILLAHLDALANSGYPGARDQAWRLRMELEQLSGEYRGVVSLDTTRAVAAIDDLTVRLNYLNRVGISAQNNINRGTAGDPDAREFGGRVLRNQAYIVGERRPELFIPDQDGVILPQVPDMAEPKGLASALPDFSFLPSSSDFDTDGVASILSDLEDTLTDHLAAMQDLEDERRTAATDTAESATTVEQHFNGPLIKVDATFGPGSAVDDLLAAMEQIADERLVTALRDVLRDHGAGVGTRGL